jgi:hypothetical protein
MTAFFPPSYPTNAQLADAAVESAISGLLVSATRSGKLDEASEGLLAGIEASVRAVVADGAATVLEASDEWALLCAVTRPEWLAVPAVHQVAVLDRAMRRLRWRQMVAETAGAAGLEVVE